jgi:hypothetical protein
MHINDQREVTEDLELGNESRAKADQEANVDTCVKLLEVEHIVDEEGEIIDGDVMRAIGAVLKHVVVSKDFMCHY